MKKYLFELPNGLIIWCGEVIVGITGATIPEELITAQAYPVGGNALDWELDIKSIDEHQKVVLDDIVRAEMKKMEEE